MSPVPPRTARSPLAALLLILGGCATTTTAPPPVITIDAGGYGEAFDAALEVGRRAGLAPALQDRRHGVIETTPAPVASLLEPWRLCGTPLGTTLESTLALQRRRARFEFAPVPADGTPAEAPPAGGPDLLATGTPPPDLTEHSGPLELRVLVILERAHMPGLRRDTWSRQLTRRALIVRGSDDPPQTTFWAPIGRDLAFEAQLRDALADALR